MKTVNRFVHVVSGVMVLSPLMPALARQIQEGNGADTTKQELPPGEGKDLLVENCIGCHELTVVTSQRKSESGWTDTIVEMRNRGANGRRGHGEDHSLPRCELRTADRAGQGEHQFGISLRYGFRVVADPARGGRCCFLPNKNGKFKDIAGLKQVPGVDAAKIDAAKDRIDF
jgi:hypothetical protein